MRKVLLRIFVTVCAIIGFVLLSITTLMVLLVFQDTMETEQDQEMSRKEHQFEYEDMTNLSPSATDKNKATTYSIW